MALTTFTSGQVLTAAQLNDSYAAVGGWRIVKNETTFSAVTQILCDNVFTSNYTFYKIIMRYTGTTGGGIFLKLRTGGTAASTNYNVQITSFASTTSSPSRLSSQTSLAFAPTPTGTFFSSTESLITGPALAEATTFMSNSQFSDAGATAPYIVQYWGNHSTATAYDGFELNAASGTITGVYSVFGIAKTGV